MSKRVVFTTKNIVDMFTLQQYHASLFSCLIYTCNRLNLCYNCNTLRSYSFEKNEIKEDEWIRRVKCPYTTRQATEILKYQ